jgi:hypothetical protein
MLGTEIPFEEECCSRNTEAEYSTETLVYLGAVIYMHSTAAQYAPRQLIAHVKINALQDNNWITSGRLRFLLARTSNFFLSFREQL